MENRRRATLSVAFSSTKRKEANAQKGCQHSGDTAITNLSTIGSTLAVFFLSLAFISFPSYLVSFLSPLSPFSVLYYGKLFRFSPVPSQFQWRFYFFVKKKQKRSSRALFFSDDVCRTPKTKSRRSSSIER